MAKKTKEPTTILEKAEIFFEKGNYSLAKKEFEKADKTLKQDDIAEKIRICEKEIAKEKAKDLIKKGRKSVKKGNLQEALQCFEEAYKISGEDWLPERILELKTELLGNRSLEAAEKAEAAGEYEKAAELYDQAITVQPDMNLLLKKAKVLVKAEKYSDAVAIFKDIELSDQSVMYDYGFALSKLKKYHEALKIWDKITISDNEFLEQKSEVQNLFATDIYQRFNKIMTDPDTENHGSQITAIYEHGKYLMMTQNDFNIPISDIAEYCRYAMIEKMWRDEQYEAIYNLLLPFPSCISSDMLALYAKLFFRLSEISDKYLPEFIIFFLTALYDPKIFEELSDDEKERELIREELIKRAEDLIKKYAENSETKFFEKNLVSSPDKALICWNIEKQLIKDIQRLVGKREEFYHLICTSQFADKFGKSEAILRLIQNNRDSFSDTEDYLKTGGYYSPAGTALLFTERGEYEKAVAALPASSEDASEFTAYCKERVYFRYGLYALEKGDNRFVKYFELCAGLFEKSDVYEKELIDRAFDAYDMDKIRRYEEALIHIHESSSTPEIQKALSLVMTRRCIDMYNEHQINFKNLEATIKRALKLDPENELANGTLERMKVDIDLDELNKAIDKLKMNKACQIASQSEFPEVKEEFFRFMDESLEHLLNEADMNDNQKIVLLHDFSRWCARADETHPILSDIDKEIRKLEG